MTDYPRPQHDTGLGLHDSVNYGSSPPNAAEHARTLRKYGFSWYKLLSDDTNKIDRAAVYLAHDIMPIVRIYKSHPHPNYLPDPNVIRQWTARGIRWFEVGNEPNLIEEWEEGRFPGSTPDKAVRVGQETARQWMKAADAVRRGGGIPLTYALAPGGNADHRIVYQAFFETLRQEGGASILDGAGLAIHPRPHNNPPGTKWTPTNTVTFDEHRWIKRLVVSLFGWCPPMHATEHGYSIGSHDNKNYPPIDERLWAEHNRELFEMMNPSHPNAVDPDLWSVNYWVESQAEAGRWRIDGMFKLWMGDGPRPDDPLWGRTFFTMNVTWNRATGAQPAPQPEPTPDPAPEPTPQPEPTPADRILDYEGLPLSIRPATVAPGAKYWRIRKAVALNPEESRGIHNVYVRCFRNGQRVTGVEVRQFWPSGAATGKTEAKPLEEWGDINFGLFGDWNPFDAEGKPTIPGPYGVEVVGASEAFVGMGLPRKQHFSYIVEFEEVTMAQPQPAPPPTPGVVDHPSQHWSPRDGRKPRYIVIHSTETPADGTTAGTLQYLTQNDRQVSIHELIMPGHPVYRMVPDDRAAHHVGYATLPNGAGGFEANLQTWGEELYNVAGRPVDKETRDRGVARAAEACKRLGLTSAEVLGHREVDPARRSDPTGIDMDAFRRDVATLLGEKREPDFRKVVWATEEAARILQREGLLVEHDYIVKEVLPPLIAKRDAA